MHIRPSFRMGEFITLQVKKKKKKMLIHRSHGHKKIFIGEEDPESQVLNLIEFRTFY